jgi:hypothetical protein
MRPEKNTYPEYYGLYIPLVQQTNVYDALTETGKEISSFIESIPLQKADHAYAAGKWTVKQVLCHIIDTERIIAYRALRFARRDPQQPLPFEEDNYVANAELQSSSIGDLLSEFEALRRSNYLMFKNFSDNTLRQKGKTHIGETTVLALGFLICGHALHHMRVIREKYLHAGEKIAAN